MSDTPINRMDFKQLRNEVQVLKDTIAIMKRKYEDILYNLDDDNFSQKIVKEKNNMKAEITVNANEIKTKVSESDMNTAIENKYSTFEQTAKEIKLSVNAIDGEVSTLKSEISLTADTISMVVNATYSKPEEVTYFYSTTADKNKIYYETASNYYWYFDGSMWRNTPNANFGSVFTQTPYGFTIDGEQTTFTGVIYLTDSENNKKFSFFHDESQGYPQVFLHGCDSDAADIPLVLGDAPTGKDHNVFIGNSASGSRVATRDWVENNANVVAVFG